MFFWLLIYVTVLGMLLASLSFLFFHYFKKLPGKSLPDADLPFVSVIVPARNEESKIGRCLESLCSQDYPNYEVIAVNDRSEDGTGRIIQEISQKHKHLKYLNAKEAPSGWIGKCSALVQGVRLSSGKYLLFTDADTCHTSNSLRYALSYAIENKAEFISFMPVQELGSFWERAVMPVLLGSFLCGDPLNTINEHTHERAYAYGQYILLSREAYEKIGGHEAVHDQILEDISLARKAKAEGYKVFSADGRLLYKVRMYTDLQSLWQGWTKNLYALIECNLLYLFLVLILLNSAILGPYLILGALAADITANAIAPGQLFFSSALLVCQFALLFAWYRRCSEHYLGVTWRHYFLLPFGSLSVTALYLHSAFLVHSGKKVSWKGRNYTVNTSKSIETEDLLNTGANTGGVLNSPKTALADTEAVS